MVKNNTKVKNLKKLLIFLTIILSCLGLLYFSKLNKNVTYADSGFDSSYDSGGSDWGGSSDWGSSSYDSSGSGDYSDGNFFGGFIAFIIIIIVFVIIAVATNKNSLVQQNNQIANSANIENKIKQYIPDFNKDQFLTDGFNIYKDVQNAWMNFNLEDVKDKLTDELFNMYESQLDTLEVKGQQNIMKDIVMKNSFLKDVSIQNNTITITTGYVIEMYDYIIEQSTGKLLRGFKNAKIRITYDMKFRKTLDANAQITKCPNCGAELKINSNGICEYCGSKIVSENTKWVLTDKKSINQTFI